MNISSPANPNPNKKRVVIVTIVMALIVLGLLIAVISVAVQKSTKTAANTPVSGEIAIDSTASGTEPEKNPSSENLAPVSNEKDSGSTSSEPANSTSSGTVISLEEVSSLPQSGPTDFLPLALLSGAITTYLLSCLALKSPKRSF